MTNRILLLLTFIFTILACNTNNKADKNPESNNRILSTIYQISPDIEAEIRVDNTTEEFTILINDDECKDMLNTPAGWNSNNIIEVNDYNFDGYKDFAFVVPNGNNKLYYVNVFNPDIKGFLSFSTFTNLEVSTGSKELIEIIKKSDAETNIHIYTVSTTNELISKANITELDYEHYVINNGPIGTLAFIKTSNNNLDNNIERTLFDSQGSIATYTTKGKRLYLYNSPKNSGKTSMYLIAGDKMELLDIEKGFFKIKFVNPKYGDIIKWIKYSGGKEQ